MTSAPFRTCNHDQLLFFLVLDVLYKSLVTAVILGYYTSIPYLKMATNITFHPGTTSAFDGFVED